MADEYSNSVIVGAPEDLLGLIKDMIEKIDQPVNDITELRVFHLKNADPMEMSDLFSQLFPDDTKTSANANQNQQGFRFGGFIAPRGNQAQTAAGSERAKKKGRVMAVPDQRTSSIIISAASELEPPPATNQRPCSTALTAP